MRLAIIADIHGNADALQAVLEDLTQRGAERIIVNGDVVNRGPDSVEVLETLLMRDDVEFTLGNHDDFLALWHEKSDLIPQAWYEVPFAATAQWQVERMQQAGLLYTPKRWPMLIRLEEIDLPPVLITHGIPENYMRGLGERTDPQLVEEIADKHQSKLLIGSHIHRPADVMFKDVQVVNTGAVGVSIDGDPSAQYLLLETTKQDWKIEFCRVSYERSGVLKRFKDSGLLATGLSAQIFYNEIQCAQSLFTPYLKWAQQEQQIFSEQTFKMFQEQNVCE